jgi:hypothetical protein
MSAAYPAGLERGSAPSSRYLEDVFAIAARQAALAGYRLAALIERIF